jgi:hypothetical protein
MDKKPPIQSAIEWQALPEPQLPNLKDESESGTTYRVVKVGFLAVPSSQCKEINLKAKSAPGGRCLLPTAVVLFDGKEELCKLPIELSEWVENSVAMAHSGIDLFPSDVEFGILKGRAYAEML